MLDSHTMKALIEAMLFVNEKPVTLRQMVARIRHVNRREQNNAVSSPVAEETPLQEIQNSPESSEESVGDDALTQLLQKKQELDDDVTIDEVKKILFALEEELQKNDRGIELVQVAKGYQLRTKIEISSYLRDEKKPAPTRLSPSSLETLAIVAYEQPVTRNKIEDVRGVDCGGVLKTLLDREFVRLVGRSDEPGRPLIYGTTGKFLEIFGLNTLRDLPSPQDFRELSFAEESGITVSDGEEPQGNEDGNEYIHTRDFADADATTLTNTERSILDELDESLNSLKEVEKGIDLFQKPVEEAEGRVVATTIGVVGGPEGGTRQ